VDAKANVTLIGGDDDKKGSGASICEAFVDLIPITAEEKADLSSLVRAFRIKGSECYCEFIHNGGGAVRVAVMAGLKAHDTVGG